MIGQVVNNYEIKSLLGEGGMGSVYLAIHPFMGRKAAIKVLRSDFANDRSQVERFMNEARAANAIRHPNIIDIIDVGRLATGVPYLMMEYLDGENLAERIRALGTLPTGAALEIAIQTASALGAAHSRHVTHRDLKPENLVLIKDPTRPGGEQVKVLDFGIAKLRGDLSGVSSKTQTGSVMGTPPYMSPEQCRGLSDEIDHRTDIYALGIILYEMLCGVPPFMSAAWGEIVLGHMSLPPTPPRTRNPAIPVVVEALIVKALAKKREDRFASMADMEAALQAARASASAAPSVAPVSRTVAIVRPTVASVSTTTGTPPPPSTTTFRGAAGEVAPPPDPVMEDELAEAGIKPRRGLRMGMTVGIVALVALGAVGAVAGGRFLSGGPKPAPVPVPPPPPPAPTPPVAPETVLLRLDSVPSGARVTNAKGQVMGVTPLELSQHRVKGELDLRFEKDGCVATGLSIPLPLYKDLDTTIRLVCRAVAPKPKARPKPKADDDDLPTKI